MKADRLLSFNMKWAATLLAALLTPTLVAAAEIHGTVLEEATGDPLDDSYVDLYKWDELNQLWNWHSYAEPLIGAFSFLALDGGSYYIQTRPWEVKYLSEYYDDTIDYSLKTDINLSASDVVALNPIQIAAKPFYIENLTIDPFSVPPEGGQVSVSGVAVNNTGASLPVTYWLNIEIYDPDVFGMGYAGWGEFTYIGPNTATLPVGSIPFALPLTIPAEAPQEWISVVLSVGTDIWTPIYSEYTAVYKQGAAMATSVENIKPASSNRIPKRIDAAGKVLEWMTIER